MFVFMDKAKNNDDYREFLKQLESKNLINKSKDLDYWGNYPSELMHIQFLNEVYTENSKFLDLGCGAGNVLRYAKNIGYDCTGVEFDKQFESELKNYNYLIQDMRDLPKSFYSGFDVIYSYIPLKVGVETYIEKIVDGMQSGSYLCIPCHNLQLVKIKRIYRFLYQKK